MDDKDRRKRENEDIVRRTFHMVLASEFPDCTIEVADNGQAAIDKFTIAHHGLLLMDVSMPLMNGYAAFLGLEKLCESKNLAMPAVIFCTGFDPPDEVLKLAAANTDVCVLAKNGERKDLVTTVAALLIAE